MRFLVTSLVISIGLSLATFAFGKNEHAPNLSVEVTNDIGEFQWNIVPLTGHSVAPVMTFIGNRKKYVGIIPAGTKITINRMRQHSGREYYMIPKEVVQPESAGDTASLQYVSTFFWVDGIYLERGEKLPESQRVQTKVSH
jgi:hypothetical protein